MSARQLHAVDLAGGEFARERAFERGAARCRACAARTTQQIECSDEPCEIITTDTLRGAQRSEHALGGAGHADHAGAFDVEQRQVVRERQALDRAGWSSPSASMRVPGCSGLNVLRMKIGRPRAIAGAIVCGWITLAPK